MARLPSAGYALAMKRPTPKQTPRERLIGMLAKKPPRVA